MPDYAGQFSPSTCSPNPVLRTLPSESLHQRSRQRPFLRETGQPRPQCWRCRSPRHRPRPRSPRPARARRTVQRRPSPPQRCWRTKRTSASSPAQAPHAPTVPPRQLQRRSGGCPAQPGCPPAGAPSARWQSGRPPSAVLHCTARTWSRSLPPESRRPNRSATHTRSPLHCAGLPHSVSSLCHV